MRRAAGLIVLTALVAACGSKGPTLMYRVPSGAMLPTLPIGSQVTVSAAPGYTPQIGDIVTFRPPSGADQVTPVCGNRGQGGGHRAMCDQPTAGRSTSIFIKRVVAGPGDTISMRNGVLTRNGVREANSYDTSACQGNSEICSFPTPVTVPAGDYYMVGDNRGASDDSRFWGPVPKASIIGKVVGVSG